MKTSKRVKQRESDGGKKNSLYPHETKDCTVRALAHATKMQYNTCHDILEYFGRYDNKGAYCTEDLYQKVLGEMLPITYKFFTLGSFVKAFPKGTYLLMIRGHALTVVDGIFLDTGLPCGKSNKVRFAWEGKDLSKGEEDYETLTCFKYD